MSHQHPPGASGDASALVDQLFTPLRLRSAGELIAERLVTAIAMGVFVPGQRLPSERELATSLNVSRTTVREAISRLAATGYVEVRRGRNGGAIVTSEAGPEADAMIQRTLAPGWDRLDRLFDFRTLIEPLIARTAATRRSEQAIERIRAALEAYRSAGDDRAASGRADGDLHRAIAEATENPYLVDLSDRIRQAVSLGFRAEPYSLAIRARAIVEHTALAEAVIVGDAVKSADIAAHHFAITEQRLRDLLARTSEPVEDHR
jgi:GntR family transcriptional repressor for pyruvate dehydrogenase complex